MKKIILMFILVFCGVIGFSHTKTLSDIDTTIICNNHVPEFTVEISKPVVLRQIILIGTGCDGNGDNIFWTIDENPLEWKTVKDPENPLKMYLIVDNPNLINKSSETKYTITIRIFDDAEPLSTFNLSKINIVIVNNKPNITK